MNLLRCCRGSVDGKTHLDGLRIYWADRMIRNMARWIEEAVENLSRRNPEILMDRESFKIYWEKEKEGLDRRESVEKLSSLKKTGFSRREKHIEMNATSKLIKHRSNQHIKLSKHLSTYKQRIHRSKTHTHTHNKSNQFYISKTS